MPKSLCIFASYDHQNIVDEYVYFYLQKIRKQLDANIIFISTAQHINKNDAKRLNQTCLAVITRPNEGYDFASYQQGILQYKEQLNNYDNVYLVNDSCYGPFADLSKITVKADMWGITHNTNPSYHIQAYFMCFTPPTYSSLIEFFSNYTAPDNYQDVINQGEIALSTYIQNQGFKLDSLLNSAEIIEQYNNSTKSDVFKKRAKNWAANTNPDISYDLWDYAIKNGSPFLKVKVARRARFRRSNADQFKWIKSNINYDIDIIKRHLKRLRLRYKKSLWRKLLAMGTRH